jgi:uncharacterized membrane protein YecN with MAPEG domain
MILPVTLTSAAAAAVMAFWLARRCFSLRLRDAIPHGHGDNDLLARRMRAQLNFVEYAPFVLILCGAIELSGKGGVWLAVVMAAFMLARISHAIGMDSEAVPASRKIGMAVTFLVLLGLALAAVLVSAGVV